MSSPASASAAGDARELAVHVAPSGSLSIERIRRVVERYLDPLNAHTARGRRHGLTAFHAWAATPSLEEAIVRLVAQGPDVAHAILDQWQQSQVRDGYADNTVRSRVLAVTGCMRLLRNVGAIAWCVEPPVPDADAYPVRSTEGCGVDGFHALVRVAHAQASPVAQRDVCILLLLWRGLRVGELCDLDLAHVELTPQPRLSILGKWRTRREYVDLADYQAAAITAWLAVRGEQPGPLVWRLDRARPAQDGPPDPMRSARERRTNGGLRLSDRGVRHVLAHLGQQAGLPTAVCHPHAIRHACGTELLERDEGNIRRMMQFMRLRSASTAIRYDDNRRKLGLEGARILGGPQVAALPNRHS